MSNFVAGIMRRAAGIASPVVVRPAAGPPLHPPPATLGVAESPPENSGTESRHPTSEAVRPMPAPAMTSLRVDDPAPAAAEIRFPERELAPSQVVVIEHVREISPFTTPEPRGDEPTSGIQPNSSPSQPARDAPLIPREAIEHESATGSARKAQTYAQTYIRPTPAAPSREVSARLEPMSDRREQMSEPVAMQPSSQPSGSPRVENRTALESRNIHVKIGKVEIRSTQQSQAAQPARAPARSGFDDFTLMRNYLDRGQR